MSLPPRALELQASGTLLAELMELTRDEQPEVLPHPHEAEAAAPPRLFATPTAPTSLRTRPCRRSLASDLLQVRASAFASGVALLPTIEHALRRQQLEPALKASCLTPRPCSHYLPLLSSRQGWPHRTPRQLRPEAPHL